MTQLSELILEKYQIRKSKIQKDEFIKLLKENFPSMKVEEKKGLMKNRNLIVGDIKKAKVVLGAHYDTPAVMPFPNFLAPQNLVITFGYQILLAVILLLIVALAAGFMSLFTDNLLLIILFEYFVIFSVLYLIMFGKANKNNANDNTSGVITLIETMSKLSNEEKENTAFIFFDNEEKGLIGSREIKRKYKKEMKDKLLVNFDCVSDGDYFLIIHNKKAENKYGEKLKETMISSENKTAILEKSSKAIYPSDQMGFPVNIGVAAFNKKPIIGYYIDKIHTKKDVIFQKENIEFLSDRFRDLIKMI